MIVWGHIGMFYISSLLCTFMMKDFSYSILKQIKEMALTRCALEFWRPKICHNEI